MLSGGRQGGDTNDCRPRLSAEALDQFEDLFLEWRFQPGNSAELEEMGSGDLHSLAERCLEWAAGLKA